MSAGLTTTAGNENEVGLGIKDSEVPRAEIFLTSKLWNTHHPNVAEGLQKALDALDVEYLDLYVSFHLVANTRLVRMCANHLLNSLFIGLFAWFQ